MSTLSHAFAGVEGRDANLYAALDIGSNSFHLVIARMLAGSMQVVQKVKHKVRLADGLDSDQMLSEEAMTRGLNTLQSMAESMQGLDPSHVRVVATHTLRRAKNARTFLRKAKAVFPFRIEVISGPEEARLIYVGVANTTQTVGKRLIVDIGGGSTEFALGADFSPLLCKSVQMGCVSYQQRYFKDGVITRKRFDRAITAARREIELVGGNLKRHEWGTSIGSSGTARAIAAVIAGLQESEIDVPITYSDLTDLIKQCIEKGSAEALDFVNLTDDRRPVFAAGLSILFAVFKSLNLKEMQTSAAALREGVLYEIQTDDNRSDIRERTAHSLATRYDVDTQYAQKVWSNCLSIYEAVKDKWAINNEELKHLLEWSALLHEVGLQINSRGVQRHSSYIIEQSDLPGFNQEQQKLIATLVRYHRKKIKLADLPTFANYDEQSLKYLLSVLRLGVLLNINRQETMLPEYQIRCKENKISLIFPEDWFDSSPLLLADIDAEAEYQQTLGITLDIV